MSPLPFGISRLHDLSDNSFKLLRLFSVSIAFRHQSSSRHPKRPKRPKHPKQSPLPFGISRLHDNIHSLNHALIGAHVSIAFRHQSSSRLNGHVRKVDCMLSCLHCLSASVVFTTKARLRQFSCPTPRSPLPFGISRLHDAMLQKEIDLTNWSLHCLSASVVFTTGVFLEREHKCLGKSPLPFGISRLHDTS